MRTVAIFSNPQECGDATLDFLSLEDGKVVKTIIMNGFCGYDAIETVYHYEPISEVITFYDTCTKQRYEIHESRRHLQYTLGTFGNKKCSKKLEIPEEYKDSDFTILDCHKVGEKELSRFSEPNKPFIVGVWEYKAAVCKETTENIYHPEQDEFMLNLEKETGIHWPREERINLDDVAIAEFLAYKLGYKLLNVLHY